MSQVQEDFKPGSSDSRNKAYAEMITSIRANPDRVKLREPWYLTFKREQEEIAAGLRERPKYKRPLPCGPIPKD